MKKRKDKHTEKTAVAFQFIQSHVIQTATSNQQFAMSHLTS